MFRMANQVDLINVLIFLFVGIAMMVNSFMVYLLLVGSIPLQTLTVALIFISLTELVATLGLWMYSGHIAHRSAPALAMLGEIARRAEMILSLSTPIFDFLEELAYRFQWSREARTDFLKEKLEEYQEKLERIEMPEEPKEASRDVLRKLKEFFSGWGKRRPTPANPEPIKVNRFRGRKME